MAEVGLQHMECDMVRLQWTWPVSSNSRLVYEAGFAAINITATPNSHPRSLAPTQPGHPVEMKHKLERRAYDSRCSAHVHIPANDAVSNKTVTFAS